MRRTAPDLLLLAIAAVWGGSYLASQSLALATSVAAVLCLRFVPSALVLLAVASGRDLRSALRAGSLLGMLRAATIAMETIGVTLTSATNAGLIIALSVLITPLLDARRQRRRVSPGLLGSAALAVCGLALIVGGQPFAPPNLGDLLVLCAAISRAFLGVTAAAAAARPRADVLALTTIEVTFCAVIFTVWGGASAVSEAATMSPTQWGWVLYLSVGCTVFAFLGGLWATKHTSASRAGLLLGTEPFWALLVGVSLAGDAFTPVMAVGAAVLFIATAWGRRAEQRWRLPQRAETP